MKEHNTREIRAAAKGLDRIADQLNRLKSSSIPQISGNAKPLQGDTADAIQAQLDSLIKEVEYLKKSVSNSAYALYEFARLLDIADEKSKALIGSK